MIDRDSYERLYLLREDQQEVYVDLPQLLPQHQLDGIRYLYRQFRKRNPGVILNDPSGYGKCLQVVLFIGALRPTLQKPILIVCDAHSVSNWKEHFEIWTSFIDEVAIESSNPYSNKWIYISSFENAHTLARRSYAIAVVEDDAVSPKALRLRLDADYKIWVTNLNLKEDLQKLSLIYEWLHPNSELNLAEFSAAPTNYLDAISKSILLDAYLEDFLIRRKDFWPLFEKSQEPEPPRVESPPQPTTPVSRKNKDPTGTKVKRSKKRRLEDDPCVEHVPLEHRAPNNDGNEGTTFDSSADLFQFTTSTISANNSNTSMLENNKTIIGKHEGSNSKNNKALVKEQDNLDKNFQSSTKNDDSNDSSNELFNFTTNTIQNKSDKESVTSKSFDTKTNNLEDDISFKNEKNDDESLTLEFKNAVNDIVRGENEIDEFKTNVRNEDVFTSNNKQNDCHKIDTQYSSKSDTQNSDKSDDLPIIEVNTNIPLGTLKAEIRENISNELIKPKKTVETEGLNDKAKHSTEEIDVKNSKVDDTNSRDNKFNNSGENKSENVKSENTVEQLEPSVMQKKKSNDDMDEFERKLLELEQHTLNKFKGTFLDRLF